MNRVCTRCGLENDISEFYINRAMPDSISRICKRCSNERCRSYYYNNKEKRLASILDWRQRNKLARKVYKWNQKARRYNSPGVLTVADYRSVIDRFGEVCLACGSGDNVSLDHIVPISVGGSNMASNLQPLCGNCNRQKGTQVVDYRPNP